MAFEKRTSVLTPARTTGNRDVITTPNLMKWAAEGKIFEAGQGIKTDAMDSQTETTLTPDKVKASVALVAPSSSDTLVIPIMLRILTEVEGGSVVDHQLIFTKKSSDCVVDLHLSGRPLVSIQNMNKLKSHSPKAFPMYGVASTFLLTVSVIVDADNVMYDFTALKDNNVVTPLPGTSQQVSWNFLSQGAPHILQQGAAMIFYISADTVSAVKFHPYLQWAEVTEEDLV